MHWCFFFQIVVYFFRPVSVIKLISKDSIEESMYKVALEKLNLEQQVTGGGNGTVFHF